MSEYRNQAAYKMVVMSPSAEALIKSQESLKDDFYICIQDSGNRDYVNGEVMTEKSIKELRWNMSAIISISHWRIPLVSETV